MENIQKVGETVFKINVEWVPESSEADMELAHAAIAELGKFLGGDGEQKWAKAVKSIKITKGE